MLAVPVGLIVHSCLLVATVVGSPFNTWKGVIRAATDGNQVYTCGASQQHNQSLILPCGGGGLTVHRGSIDRGVAVSGYRVPLMVDWVEPQRAPLRWQFRAGQFHVVRFWPLDPNGGSRGGRLQTFPTADLELCSLLPNDPRPEETRNATWRLFQSRVAEGISLNPYDGQLIVADDLKWPRVYFDFLIAKDGSYQLYVLARGKLTFSTLDPRSKEKQAAWVEKASWTTDCSEPFYLAMGEQDRYFVTEAGRLFRTPRSGEPAKTLLEVKSVPRSRALIHDEMDSITYAFTDETYFALTGDLRARTHSLGAIKGRTADEALETVIKCARIIRGLKTVSK